MSKVHIPVPKAKDSRVSDRRTWHRRRLRLAILFSFIRSTASCWAWRTRRGGWRSLVVLAALLVLAGVAARYLPHRPVGGQRQSGDALVSEWREFDEAADRLDIDDMRIRLERIAALAPGNVRAEKRRASLERGLADADDQTMIVFWMRRHLMSNRIHDAADAARQRIQTVADDWQAHFILAHDAINRGLPDVAVNFLCSMPSPLANRHPLDPAGLAYGLALHARLKLDDASLRTYRATRLVPIIREPSALALEPCEQLQLLETYVYSLEDLHDYPDLLEHWPGSSLLADSLLNDTKSGVDSLIRLGRVQQSQLDIVHELVRKQKLAVKQAEPLADTLLQRLDVIWRKVRELAPRRPEGYLGTAWLGNRRGRTKEALAYLERGQEHCDDRRELIRSQARLLQKTLSAVDFLRKMEQLAAKNLQHEWMHRLVADAALAAGNFARVVDACRDARNQFPDQSWPSVLEARVLLELGQAAEALQALQACKEHLGSDAAIGELYIQALCRSGKPDEVGPFLQRLIVEGDSPSVLVSPLRAALQEGRVREAAEAADAVLKRYPKYDKDLLLTAAEVYSAAAEPQSEMAEWNTSALQTATRLCYLVQSKEPNSLEAANKLAWLQLKGFQAFDMADRAAAPLRQANQEGKLPVDMLETLGAVELTMSHFEAARRLLEKAVIENSTAGKHVHLALAYYHLQDLEEARRQLALAGSLPHSPRISQELNKASELVGNRRP